MAVEIENELSFRDYVLAVKRRWRWVYLSALLVFILVVIVAYNLTPVYVAEGLISIESPVISRELIGQDLKETPQDKYADESVDKVKQKILSRENLVQLNKKYKLYPALEKPIEVSAALSRDIKISPDMKSTTSSAWSDKVTVGLFVGFQSSDPNTTYEVTNDLIKQLMDENLKDRTQRATEATSFLTDELAKLSDELSHAYGYD